MLCVAAPKKVNPADKIYILIAVFISFSRYSYFLGDFIDWGGIKFTDRHLFLQEFIVSQHSVNTFEFRFYLSFSGSNFLITVIKYFRPIFVSTN